MAAPKGSNVHTLIIGNTFGKNSSNSFTQMKYNFMPKSVNENEIGKVNVQANGKAVVTLDNNEFEGNKYIDNRAKGTRNRECVLIIDHDTNTVTLEKLSNIITLQSRKNLNIISKQHVPQAAINRQAPTQNLNKFNLKKKIKPNKKATKKSKIEDSNIRPHSVQEQPIQKSVEIRRSHTPQDVSSSVYNNDLFNKNSSCNEKSFTKKSHGKELSSATESDSSLSESDSEEVLDKPALNWNENNIIEKPIQPSFENTDQTNQNQYQDPTYNTQNYEDQMSNYQEPQNYYQESQSQNQEISANYQEQQSQPIQDVYGGLGSLMANTSNEKSEEQVLENKSPSSTSATSSSGSSSSSSSNSGSSSGSDSDSSSSDEEDKTNVDINRTVSQAHEIIESQDSTYIRNTLRDDLMISDDSEA